LEEAVAKKETELAVEQRASSVCRLGLFVDEIRFDNNDKQEPSIQDETNT
jgi:hypothetical protein